LIEAVAERYRLSLPRGAYAGRVGGVLGRQAGGSMELQDFRAYQPGDDVRNIDWNAAARTDQVIVRIRREEVSPLVEVVVDASASMGITPTKATRTTELAWTFCRMARSQGLESALVIAGSDPVRLRPPEYTHLRNLRLEGGSSLPALVARGLPLRPCGIRVVVSDLLFDTPPEVMVSRLARGATALVLVQPLDQEEREPSEATFVELVDSESGERIERALGPTVIDEYKRRLAAHQSEISAAARKHRAGWTMVPAERSLPVLFREHLVGAGVEARP